MANMAVYAIIAVVLFIAVAIPVTITTVGQVTALTSVQNEVITLNSSSQVGNQYNNQSITLANSRIVHIAAIKNSTGEVTLVAANFTQQGYDTTRQAYNNTIHFNQLNVSTFTGPNLIINYTYQPTTYDYSATNRQLYSMLPLGLAVGTIIVIFGMLG